jgi:UDP-glucose 4-epimerase
VTAPGPVNLAFGGRASLLELADQLGVVLGRTLTLAHGPTRAGDVHDSQADQQRLRALFPDVTPIALADGLRATVEWFAAAAAPSTPGTR